MLQGFETNKLTALIHGAVGRVPREDVLTAAVFGSLSYVEPTMALRMLRVLFGEMCLIVERPSNIAIDLWPKFHDLSGAWIEPDVIIDIVAGEKSIARLIVEAKWNAPLGPRQAIEQWKRCQSRSATCWHIFPVRSTTSISAQLQSSESAAVASLGAEAYANWVRHRRCVSWFELSGRLAQVRNLTDSEENRRLARWAAGVLSVLKLLGEKPFEGFERLRNAVAMPHLPIFWRGATRFEWRPSKTFSFDQFVFFRASNG